MHLWRATNSALYRALYAVRRARARRAARATPATPAGPPGSGLLFVSWGRVGDALLATGALARLRTALGVEKVTCLGRAGTEPVLTGQVDAFVPFSESRWEPDRIAGRLHAGFSYLVGDIHLFYGGTFLLKELLEWIPAARKFHYEGYHRGPGLAPSRLDPHGFEIIPALAEPGRHVLHHYAHYTGAILERLGLPRRNGLAVPIPPPVPPPVTPLRSALEAGSYIAWQPASNNRRKDYPAERWRQVLAAFPGERFVALGSARERRPLHLPPGVDLLDLRGETDLPEAMQLIQGAKAYLGLDSGLSHIAAALETPGVCVIPASNLGSFFPYPEGVGGNRFATVFDPAYAACAGCFMTCSRESILRTRLRGAKCLRGLDPARVVAALRGVL